MAKVDPGTALAEFERLAAAADVNIDPTGMDDEDAESLEETQASFTQAIERGELAVDDEGRAVMSVADSTITFRVPLGADLMIMASANDNKRMEAMERFVCALTGQPTDRIRKLRKREWKLAMRIAGFLSAD